MGVIIPSGYALMSIGTKTPGDPENMYWTVGMLVDDETYGDLPDRAADAWGSTMASITSSAVDLVHVIVKEGPNSTGPTFEWLGEEPGVDAGALPPPNCAVLVRKITGLGGRKQRGRAYIPGVSSFSASLDSAGNFSSGDAAEITTAVGNFFTGIDTLFETTSVAPVLLHSDSTPPTTIAAFSCEPKLATQRRRLRG